MPKNLRNSVAAAAKEVESTLKKMQDKKQKTAAAEAKAAGKKERAPASGKGHEKATVLDLEWSVSMGVWPAESSNVNLQVPFVIDGSQVMQFIGRSSQCQEFIAKFVTQVALLVCQSGVENVRPKLGL